MPDTIRVLWVDDSPDLLSAYTRLVRRTPGLEMIGTLDSADDLVSESARLSPDVVVIDLTMPGKEPLSAVTELSGKLPNVRSIVFSGYDDHATVQSAVDAGAWGLVPKLKGGLPGDVLGAIRRVIQGEMCFPAAH
jgi:DNA-binding NarL/FixJ family response regulator